MIATAIEYQKAQDESHDLKDRLRGLEQSHPGGDKGVTTAGVRK